MWPYSFNCAPTARIQKKLGCYLKCRPINAIPTSKKILSVFTVFLVYGVCRKLFYVIPITSNRLRDSPLGTEAESLLIVYYVCLSFKRLNKQYVVLNDFVQ